VIEKRALWQTEQKKIDSNKLIFLDESSINCGMTPHYGRALKSQRVNEYVPDTRFEQTTVVSALRLNGKRASLMFRGALNGEMFTAYVKEVLSPIVKKGDVVILDNLTAHKVAGALDPIYKKGASVMFLPPYSPDYNPIELCWSHMKSMIRKCKPRSFDELVFAMRLVLGSEASVVRKNWFRHCGYMV